MLIPISAIIYISLCMGLYLFVLITIMEDFKMSDCENEPLDGLEKTMLLANFVLCFIPGINLLILGTLIIYRRGLL